MNLEDYFSKYRVKTIGINHTYKTYCGERTMIYADWAASGRLYKDIEDILLKKIGVLYGNTHSEDNYIGEFINSSYNQAKEIIRKHVKANDEYVVLTTGYGMTAAIHKLHEIMDYYKIGERTDNEKPIVFLTNMEHNSNYANWLELDVDFEIVNQDKDGTPSLEHLEVLLKKHIGKKVKIGAFTACSNITGIRTNYHQMAALMHKYSGLCFIDFSSSAPYVDIDVNFSDQERMLDAIYFSPHKFLGGPGSSGVLVFHKKLYKRRFPSMPGGGTVLWTNPWGGRKYYNDINKKEDGGTPGILQTIKAALAMELKENMNVEYIQRRENEINNIFFSELENVEGITIYEETVRDRLGIVSFNIDKLHYKLVVKILSDVFGIQARGGCSCSGLYGHYLLKIDQEHSKIITDSIDQGNLYGKPGWVRLSFNPIMTDDEIYTIVQAIKEIIDNKDFFLSEYEYCETRNTFINKKEINSYTLSNIFT